MIKHLFLIWGLLAALTAEPGPSVVLMRAIHVPIYLQIPCAAVVAFCTSWFLVAMAYRCFGKRTKWVLG